MILVVDSDEVFARALVRIIEKLGEIGQTSKNALLAMELINAGELPEIIFLETCLTGPDGFTLLNELSSYADTMKIPIVIVSDLDFSKVDLTDYNVMGYLNKETMRPRDVHRIIKRICGAKNG